MTNFNFGGISNGLLNPISKKMCLIYCYVELLLKAAKTMKKILASIMLTLSLTAPANAFVGNGIINVDGTEERLDYEDPLRNYYNQNYDRFKPYTNSPACTRYANAYKAYWEIKNRKLYLNKFQVQPCNDSVKSDVFIPLFQLFPGQPQPVFADWYSGEITLTRGKIRFVYLSNPMGPQGEYRHEKYLKILIEKGVVISESTILNPAYSTRRKGDW
jgi:hypothetical protein